MKTYVVKVLIIFVFAFTHWHGTQAQAGQVKLIVSNDAVEKVAAAAFPVTISGRKSIGVGFLKQDMKYSATVNSPRITFKEGEGIFTSLADVALEGSVKLTEVPVRGKLVVSYDNASGAIVVDVANAIMEFNAVGGSLSIRVDVSEDIPMFPLSVSVPQLSVPVGEKDIIVKPLPKLSLEDGHILVDLELDIVDMTRKTP